MAFCIPPEGLWESEGDQHLFTKPGAQFTVAERVFSPTMLSDGLERAKFNHHLSCALDVVSFCELGSMQKFVLALFLGLKWICSARMVVCGMDREMPSRVWRVQITPGKGSP